MSVIPVQSDPHAEQVMTEALRRMTPGERLRVASGMWRSATSMLSCSIKDENPEWTAEQIQREVARRLSHGAV